MRGRDLLSWLPGLVLAFLLATFMGAMAIWGDSSFYVGFVPGLLIGLWFMIFVQRETVPHSSRRCPRCSRLVKVGVLDCPHCGFDFRTIGRLR